MNVNNKVNQYLSFMSAVVGEEFPRDGYVARFTEEVIISGKKIVPINWNFTLPNRDEKSKQRLSGKKATYILTDPIDMDENMAGY